jgi:hypothetical protein
MIKEKVILQDQANDQPTTKTKKMTELTMHLPTSLPIGVLQYIIQFHAGHPELVVNMYKAFAPATDDTEVMHFYKTKAQTYLNDLAYGTLVLLPQSNYFDALTDGEIIRVYDAIFNSETLQYDDHTLNEFMDCTGLIADLDSYLPFGSNHINLRALPRIQLLEAALLTKSQALLDCVKFNFYESWMALYIYFKHNHQVYGASAALTNDTGLLDLLFEFSRAETLTTLLGCGVLGWYSNNYVLRHNTNNVVNPNLALTKRVLATNPDIHMHGLSPYEYWLYETPDTRREISHILTTQAVAVKQDFNLQGLSPYEYWTKSTTDHSMVDKDDKNLVYLKTAATIGDYLRTV